MKAERCLNSYLNKEEEENKRNISSFQTILREKILLQLKEFEAIRNPLFLMDFSNVSPYLCMIWGHVRRKDSLIIEVVKTDTLYSLLKKLRYLQAYIKCYFEKYPPPLKKKGEKRYRKLTFFPTNGHYYNKPSL